MSRKFQSQHGRYSWLIKVSLLIVIFICLLCLAFNSIDDQTKGKQASFDIVPRKQGFPTENIFPTQPVKPLPNYLYPEIENILVVLGNEPLDDATPTIDTMTRVRKAVKFFSVHPSSILIFTGGPTANKVTEAQVMANYAMSLGVPKDVIR